MAAAQIATKQRGDPTGSASPRRHTRVSLFKGLTQHLTHQVLFGLEVSIESAWRQTHRGHDRIDSGRHDAAGTKQSSCLLDHADPCLPLMLLTVSH